MIDNPWGMPNTVSASITAFLYNGVFFAFRLAITISNERLKSKTFFITPLYVVLSPKNRTWIKFPSIMVTVAGHSQYPFILNNTIWPNSTFSHGNAFGRGRRIATTLQGGTLSWPEIESEQMTNLQIYTDHHKIQTKNSGKRFHKIYKYVAIATFWSSYQCHIQSLSWRCPWT